MSRQGPSAPENRPGRSRIPAPVVERLLRRADPARWHLEKAVAIDALERSVSHRFREGAPSPADVGAFLDTLHLEDLWLSVACAEGVAEAWDEFVRQYRPVLYRTAEGLAPAGDARELADSLYADLFGLQERAGVRRSLFRYYHGRSSLAGWLRAVLAQRVVDLARARRRTTALDDLPPGREPASAPPEPDPDRERYLSAFRRALEVTLRALDPRDRLRLSLYYARTLTLAQAGQLLGEHESTVSRRLERTRRRIRKDVEQALLQTHGLTREEIALCFDYAVRNRALDLAGALHEAAP